MDFKIKDRIEHETVVLTVAYGYGEDTRTKLSQEMVQRYRTLRAQKGASKSCIVEIQSEVAGSAIVRALFDLWKEVADKEKDQLICVNYPRDYIGSLNAIGLTTLRGFSLAESVEEALRQLRKI